MVSHIHTLLWRTFVCLAENILFVTYYECLFVCIFFFMRMREIDAFEEEDIDSLTAIADVGAI